MRIQGLSVLGKKQASVDNQCPLEAIAQLHIASEEFDFIYAQVEQACALMDTTQAVRQIREIKARYGKEAIEAILPGLEEADADGKEPDMGFFEAVWTLLKLMVKKLWDYVVTTVSGLIRSIAGIVDKCTAAEALDKRRQDKIRAANHAAAKDAEDKSGDQTVLGALKAASYTGYNFKDTIEKTKELASVSKATIDASINYTTGGQSYTNLFAGGKEIGIIKFFDVLKGYGWKTPEVVRSETMFPSILGIYKVSGEAHAPETKHESLTFGSSGINSYADVRLFANHVVSAGHSAANFEKDIGTLHGHFEKFATTKHIRKEGVEAYAGIAKSVIKASQHYIKESVVIMNSGKVMEHVLDSSMKHLSGLPEVKSHDDVKKMMNDNKNTPAPPTHP